MRPYRSLWIIMHLYRFNVPLRVFKVRLVFLWTFMGLYGSI